jgi:RHH-type proline utilization regulon transcriptional repressor/proline dehydrogenase/delta 1-pyrroline-5-carboxylate dehydrogenase
VFGPVLHVATFKASELEQVVADINASGYGLTFGLHTRIDDRVETVTQQLRVGNMYINRNQIGAVVGSQPFGGEGLSGTGPKAGGPYYLPRFMKAAEAIKATKGNISDSPNVVSKDSIQTALDALAPASQHTLQTRQLPGPTGESNQWKSYARGKVLCFGGDVSQVLEQAQIALDMGCSVLAIAENMPESSTDTGSSLIQLSGSVNESDLVELQGFDVVSCLGSAACLRSARMALAAREGAIIPLVSGTGLAERCVLERHYCIDTTAAGGNAALLASSES